MLVRDTVPSVLVAGIITARPIACSCKKIIKTFTDNCSLGTLLIAVELILIHLNEPINMLCDEYCKVTLPCVKGHHLSNQWWSGARCSRFKHPNRVLRTGLSYFVINILLKK